MATQSNPKYTLSGRITDLQGGPLEGLMVRAFDQDPRSSDDQLGQAVTSEEGKYSIRFTQKDFKIDGVESGGPDVYIQVYAKGELLEKSAVRRNAKNRITINLQVDYIVEDAAPEKAFIVRGLVRRSDGRPLLDVIIRAHDQGLRKRSNLGEAKTDASGRYEIGYDKESLLDLERGSANLLVEVIGAGGATLATSEVRFNARLQETVNLTADTDATESEWERLEARLAPALNGAVLTTLSDEELSFLEKSARLQTEQLKIRMRAARAAAQSELPEWFHFALLRQGLPGELDGLLGTPELRIRKALSDAQQAGIVAASSEKETAAFWQRLEMLQTERALDKPITGRRLKVRQVLEVAGLEQEPQQILAKALADKDLQRPDTWATLQTETGLEAAILDRVQFTLRTAELADDHLATIAALHGDERVHSLRDLAQHYDLATWHELVEKTAAQDGNDLPAALPGNTAAERRAQFARRLFDRVAELHPDVAVIYALSRHPRLAERPATRLLPQLLETNAGFDLARVRVDAYLGYGNDSCKIAPCGRFRPS